MHATPKRLDRSEDLRLNKVAAFNDLRAGVGLKKA